MEKCCLSQAIFSVTSGTLRYEKHSVDSDSTRVPLNVQQRDVLHNGRQTFLLPLPSGIKAHARRVKTAAS